ncbi:hypothetical protein AWN76_008460 [Rhodothermaceae bacterium RA]|nr:hypothetical protein AWN76_008460 [Rhodothermaceae bacterium RA]
MPATVAVPASLQALLHGAIDYAGLFPPARLSMEETVRRYLAHQAGPDAWMLGRLVLPAARLADLGALPGVLMPEAPLRLSVLAGHGAAPDTFATNLRADLAAIAAFQQCFDAEVRVEALEVRLPERLQRAADVQGVLQALWEAIDHAAPGSVPLTALFLEVPRSERQRALVEAVSEALPAFDLPRLHVGLKMRCGGLRPEAIPTADFVAFFLAACRRAGVRFKATAGLHHPLRHWDAALGVPAHGFLNVLGAAVLARVHPIGPARIRRILEADDPEALHFDDDGLAWEDLHAGLEQIREARAHAATSFGSCSFAEPVRALRTLGRVP